MIYTLYNQGNSHKINEDAQLVYNTNEYLYLAVMDGCSGGIDSVFASYLIKKCLNQIITNRVNTHNQLNNVEAELNCIYKELFLKLKSLQLELSLHNNELESTLGLAIIKDDNVSMCFAGDGVYSIDENLVVIDQNNRPNYLINNNNLESLINNTIFYNSKFTDQVAISTDGVESFIDNRRNKYNLADEFIFNTWNIHNEKCLTKKLNLIKKGRFNSIEKMINDDDISMIVYKN